MFKRYAKAVSLFLCAAMLVSLTACSSGTSSATSSTASMAAADPFGKYQSTVTLTTVRSLDSDTVFDTNDSKYASLTQNLWASAYTDTLNVEFNYLWTPASADYDTKWNTAIASGDIPDCAQVDATVYKELLDAGYVEDMTGYFNSYASDLYKQANIDDGGVTLKYMTTNGVLYGLPYNGSQPDNESLLYIRKDWLKKVNMSEPKTIDDLINVAKAFKDAKLGGKDTYGIFMNSSIGTYLTGFLNGYGAYYDIWMNDGSGKLVYSTTLTDKWESALLKLQEMYKDGLIAKDFSVKQVEDDIASGKVGIVYCQFWEPINTGIKTSYANDTNAEWEVLCPPTSDGSKYLPQSSASVGSFIFVKKGCSHPEAVVKVCNLTMKLYDDDFDTYGAAKTTSNGVAIQTIKYRFPTDLFKPWKNLNIYLDIKNARDTNDTSKLGATSKSVYNDVMAAVNGSKDATKKATEAIFGNVSSYSIINTFKENNQFLIDAFQTLPTDTMSSKGNTIKTNLDSAILKVIMGDDISTYEKAVQAWKTGGGDQITTEVNAWYSSNSSK